MYIGINAIDMHGRTWRTVGIDFKTKENIGSTVFD